MTNTITIALCCFFLLNINASFAFFEDSSVQQENLSKPTERLADWKTLISLGKSSSAWQKINKVNQFFNKIQYASDADHWGVPDYWATPIEFINSNGGDCEDYAIAKYYTLAAMGVSPSVMRLTHVTLVPDEQTHPNTQAHMVLLIKEKDTDIFLTLDNRSDKILPFKEYKDLLPIYSFNNAFLWITKSKHKMTKVGEAKQIKRWVDLMQRVREEALP